MNKKLSNTKQSVIDRFRSKNDTLLQVAQMLLVVTLVLLPVIVIPSGLFSFTLTKGIVATLGILLVLMLWLFSSLKKGTLTIPYNPFMIALGVLPLVYFVSAIFSRSFSRSFFGRGFETDAVLTVLLLSLVAFLTSIVMRKRSILLLLGGLFGGFLIVVVFQLLRFVIGPEALSLGIFTSNVGNLVGSWNDLAMFAGVFAILSLVALELPLQKWQKSILYATIALSLVTLAVVNFTLAWIIVGIFALLFFIYTLSFGVVYVAQQSGGEKTEFPARPLVVFLVSLVFVIGGGAIGDTISSFLNVSQVQARPSWEATFNLAGDALVRNPLLGSGPNTFTYEWLLNKPEGVNSTVFWNTDFSVGIGVLPTSLVTTGVLGFLAWLAVLGLFLWFGIRSIGTWKGKHDSILAFLEIATFLAAIYGWIFMFLYVPSLTLMVLTFAFMGIFAAVQYQKGLLPSITVSGSESPREAFLVTFVVIGVLVGVVAWGYASVARYSASIYFQSALTEANSGDASIDEIEGKIQRAVRLSARDEHYRTLAQLYQLRLNNVLSQQDVSDDVLRSEFQGVLSRTVGYAQQAIEAGPREYSNHFLLANIYASIVPLGVDGAYENALLAYDRVEELNPHSPAVELARARLALANNSVEDARQYITAAIEKKPNYTEAVFLLSQIEAQTGNTEEAISAAQSAALLAPNDPTVFFQLGLLHYSEENYQSAVPAFERAVVLSPTYSNAKYFLGLSYNQIGRNEDAIGQFEDLVTLNPDNQEVQNILQNLRAGTPPFAGLNEQEAEPLEQEELPIEE